MNPASYDAHARTLPRDDLWGQVRRGGVPESQIQLIEDMIIKGCDMRPDDCVLDLFCGNGALSARLFDHCARFVGVDGAPYLIEIANEKFGIPNKTTFYADDVVNYAAAAENPEQFTKVMVYSGFQYLSPPDAEKILLRLHGRFKNVHRIFLGSLPDKTYAARFYPGGYVPVYDLGNNLTEVGLWRTKEEMIELGQKTGWAVEIVPMLPDFSAAHYRFNAVLHRRIA